MSNNLPQDDRSLSVPTRDSDIQATPQREAASDLIRAQIDRVYDDSQETQPANDTSVYKRTHDESVARAATQTDGRWQQYHSAWQQYYQQYYERYYIQQVHNQRAKISHAAAGSTGSKVFPLDNSDDSVSQKGVTKDQAVGELREQLLGKVREHSTTARKSRHFLPIMSALAVMFIFLFLQYNRVLVAQVKAYVSPGAVNPQNIILDPTTDIKVGPEPKLIIPKINVEAPIVYDVGSLADAPVQQALKGGVVHYPIPGANSRPGEKGNNVILGHSSNDVFDDGAYKFIFVQLEQLQEGDTFYIHHGGTRYTYNVTGKEIIEPNQINKLILPMDKPLVSLVTCTPNGTALKRLVVYAEQISPDPSSATASTDTSVSDPSSAPIPGNSPTFFERLFGS